MSILRSTSSGRSGATVLMAGVLSSSQRTRLPDDRHPAFLIMPAALSSALPPPGGPHTPTSTSGRTSVEDLVGATFPSFRATRSWARAPATGSRRALAYSGTEAISTKTCQKANLKQFKKASFKFNTRWRKGAWTYLLTIMELACSIWSSPQVSTVAS
jgi:hypothetical protein